MDPRLQQAAESGSIDQLYALIDENPYVLDNIDAVPFVNTPLHIAAASGNLPFALEILNLKPSFATKLNTSGYSPLHLAVENDHGRFVTWLITHNPSLVCAKGREGITPFLLLVIRGDVDGVAECLTRFPECIKDVSVNGENALHLAVINDRFEVLKVVTGWIQKMSQRDALSLERSVLNRVDFNDNTALHIAAYKNDQQAVKLLLECREVKRNKVNNEGLTFLDILRNQGHNIAPDLDKTIVKTGCKEAASMTSLKSKSDFLKSPITYWSHLFTFTRRIRRQTSNEAHGIFLIISTLLITSTYQTALQPPGGVHQSDDANAGTATMKRIFFNILWISNTLGFSCALFYTFCLLPIDDLFEKWFYWIGASLGVSYAVAMAMNSPSPFMFLISGIGYVLFIPLLNLVAEFCAFRWIYKSGFKSQLRGI